MPNFRMTPKHATMKLSNGFYVIVFIVFICTSCNDFQNHNGENIVGKYYIQAVGDFRPSLNYKVDTSEVEYFKTIVRSYTYEVQWNDKFILVHQHPEYAAKNEAYESIRSKIWLDAIKKMNKMERNIYLMDTSFKKAIDSITQIEFQERLENRDLAFIKTIKQEDVIFHYLIDIKKNPEEPIAFFNKDSLNIWLDKLQVGELTNKRTY